MNAVVLYGDVSEEAGKDEKDVLVEVEVVSEALSNLGYKPVAVPLSIDIRRAITGIQEHRPLFVFNLVESVEGQGQFIYLASTILDYLKISYTGSMTDAIYLTSNKLLTKKFLRASDILTPDFLSIDDVMHDRITFDGPYIIKSIWEHASIGLSENSVVFERHILKEKIGKLLSQKEEKYFVEAYIDGREFNISLLAGDDGPQVPPPAEIRFVDYDDRLKMLGYSAKWDEESFEYQHTPRCFDFTKKDAPLLQELTEISKNCWDLFGLRGYGRVDFRVDHDGKPWVLEININPCLSPDSGFAAATARAGLSFNEAIQRIINAS